MSTVRNPVVPDTVAVGNRACSIDAATCAVAGPADRVATMWTYTPSGPMCPETLTGSRVPRKSWAEGQGVDAEVEQGAAAVGRVPVPAVGVVGNGKAYGDMDVADVADHPGGDRLPRLLDGGVELDPHGIGEQDAVFGGQAGQGAGLAGGDGERLFAQDVLAGADGLGGHGEVGAVRGAR